MLQILEPFSTLCASSCLLLIISAASNSPLPRSRAWNLSPVPGCLQLILRIPLSISQHQLHHCLPGNYLRAGGGGRLQCVTRWLLESVPTTLLSWSTVQVPRNLEVSETVFLFEISVKAPNDFMFLSQARHITTRARKYLFYYVKRYLASTGYLKAGCITW